MTAYTNGRLLPPGTPLPAGEPAVAFIPAEDACAEAKNLGMENIMLPVLDESAANRFESHRGYDCLLLNIPDGTDNVEAPPLNIDVYCAANRLFFVHDPHPVIESLKALLVPHGDDQALPQERVLPTFLSLLTAKDSAAMEEIEEEIAALEDMLADDKQLDYTAKISALRKRLLKLKRYYESLFDAMVDMEENQNGFWGTEQMRHFHIITNRADRLQRSVLNLRDYVTQVRESYQAQLDISLNNTMRLFTVITAVFLPLTLLVGWYGMNLMMPEFNWPYSYPVVIGISVAIVVGCLVYFKRRKWF